MKQDILDQVRRIHFVGTGGLGMCSLVEVLHHEGSKLAGSDVSESDTLNRVHFCGIPASMGYKTENIGDAQLLVYTAAVKYDNPELMAVKECSIPVVERSVMLEIATCRYENSIAVPGTHDKTTTTAMITQVCIDGGVDPSATIGGKLPAVGGNGRVGESQTIICETCEYVDALLQLTPAISVILNIDANHLDYLGMLENIIKPFHQFSSQTSRLLVINGDDPNCRKAVEGIQNARITTFGINPDNDYAVGGISDLPKACENFSVYKHGEKPPDVALPVPGKYSIMNVLAAVAVSDYLGINPKTAVESPGRFTGVHRRFEILGKFDGVTVADGSAHHPTELTTTLTAASRMGSHTVWALLQLHTYSCTYLLFDDFVKALSTPERVVLSPTPAVRETNIYHIYSKDLAEKVPGSVCLSSSEEMADYAMSRAQSGDLIPTLGGGNTYRCANLIAEKCQKKDSLLKA